MKTTVVPLMLVFFTMLSASVQGQFSYIAHRGASFLAPENTVSAVQLAWELKADAVEIDVHLTKDNRIVVFHDFNTRKITGQKLEIRETDSAVLRGLDVGLHKGDEFRGERMPFLEEVIATIPAGRKLVVEVKCGSEIIPALKKIVEESGKQEQLVFISFGWQTILDLKRSFPLNECYWLSSSRIGLPGRMVSAADYGLDGVNLHHSVIDERIMNRAKSLGIKVWAWTIDDPAEVRRLAQLGVEGITTNRPGWLREQFGESGFAHD